VLELSALSCSFGALKVIDGLDLHVQRGELLGVLGPNGAGKTTLFNLVAGVITPGAGSVRFEGRDISRLRAWERCHLGIARTYQVPHPFSGMSVFDNVLVAAVHGARLRSRSARERARAVLARTGLAHRADRAAGELSLLDLKRLELAKALALGPRLLLLDEIAGGLTDAECQTLLDIVRAVRAEGVTIVWIEHVVHALKSVASRFAVLHYGRILCSGAPQDVMADPRVKEVYLGVAA
jgi:branched-chain amino acid transport system ATP-binding protein